MSAGRNNRLRPASRLREQMGQELRAAYTLNLTEALHRAFDSVSVEPLPGSLARLVERLQPQPHRAE